ncbi:hypothetical protein RJ640_024616 [Escallonia rubra]|uniref:J domain-containing protein n=1 Tax=Escallonia rubra TaxID=112253 RepID=A0AA88USI9_9ASTE|nr:hypothetical protein RJ640_024616 [Escallonia rubra]
MAPSHSLGSGMITNKEKQVWEKGMLEAKGAAKWALPHWENSTHGESQSVILPRFEHVLEHYKKINEQERMLESHLENQRQLESKAKQKVLAARKEKEGAINTRGCCVKQCQYKVLGLGGDCTAGEIRSAYRRLVLQRHPDKLAQFGISPAAYRRLSLQAYQTSPFPASQI